MTEANGHSAGPARGRGRGRGRGGARGGLSRAAAIKKPAGNGRRGRQKLYGSVRAQASAERQRELKANYSALMAACLSATEDLAQRTIDKLKSDVHAHEEVKPQYQETLTFLDGRLESAVQKYNTELAFRANDLAQTKQLNEGTSTTHFHVRRIPSLFYRGFLSHILPFCTLLPPTLTTIPIPIPRR